MTHDFNTAVVDLHGVNQTIRVEKPFGGKNIDVLCDLFADSVETGKRSSRLPSMRDSAIASEYAWTFLKDTRKHDLPAIGNLRTLEQIRERRKNMKMDMDCCMATFQRLLTLKQIKSCQTFRGENFSKREPLL